MKIHLVADPAKHKIREPAHGRDVSAGERVILLVTDRRKRESVKALHLAPRIADVSSTDRSGHWKSCPNCSALNRGDQHVFHRFPGEFGTSEKRASMETSDGRQSWCENAAKKKGPTAGRPCNQPRR
jgi:hypothetical protein